MTLSNPDRNLLEGWPSRFANCLDEKSTDHPRFSLNVSAEVVDWPVRGEDDFS